MKSDPIIEEKKKEIKKLRMINNVLLIYVIISALIMCYNYFM
jgi:hypothetical protein